MLICARLPFLRVCFDCHNYFSIAGPLDNACGHDSKVIVSHSEDSKERDLLILVNFLGTSLAAF